MRMNGDSYCLTAALVAALLLLMAVGAGADDLTGETESAGDVGAVSMRTAAEDGQPDPGGPDGRHEDADLEQRYATLVEAWKHYLEDEDNETRRAFQVEMADFLNDAVNNYPGSPWTRKGVDLYCESRMKAAAEQARRFGNYARSARMLEAVRAYYDLIGAQPSAELVEAIASYDARASR